MGQMWSSFQVACHKGPTVLCRTGPQGVNRFTLLKADVESSATTDTYSLNVGFNRESRTTFELQTLNWDTVIAPNEVFVVSEPLNIDNNDNSDNIDSQIASTPMQTVGQFRTPNFPRKTVGTFV